MRMGDPKGSTLPSLPSVTGAVCARAGDVVHTGPMLTHTFAFTYGTGRSGCHGRVV